VPTPLHLWRISNHRSLTGEGGLRYAARWHSAGRRIVYLAESPAGAMIEVLVHLELDDSLPSRYTLLCVEIPEKIRIHQIAAPSGNAWKTNLKLSRRLGDEWLAQVKTALARVPSAILPETYNYLLNPLHPDAGSIKIIEVKKAVFDPRLYASIKH